MDASIEGEIMEISIPMYDEELTLLYRVKDAAGNEAQTLYNEKAALSHFLVTNNKMVQFVKKPIETVLEQTTPTSVGGVACVSLGAAATLVHIRKKRRAKYNILK